jgi:predicted nucleic acid-binding Zn ribbon protein
MPDRGPLPRAVGVYDRPRVRRSRLLLMLLGAIVVAIVFVWMFLLR